MSKIAAVTGANSGIGKEICRGLLEAGYQVLMLCRNPEKAAIAQAELQHTTGSAQIEIMCVDLASLKDIVRVATDMRARFSHLNVLVNNAGLFSGKAQNSEDGYELTFAVNHLAVQLLTNQLLPLLEAGAAQDTARIVNVASEAHRRGKIHIDDVQMRRSYSGMAAYSQSKLANILHALWLSPQLNQKNVVINACHPGVVATNFANGEGGAMGWLFKMFKWAMITPEKGAATPLFLAKDPLPQPVSGRYYDKCKPKRPISSAQDIQLAEKLYGLSEELIQAALSQ